MKFVTVTLLLLAAAGNISAGGSRQARESSGSYSGYINGKHYGGSYRTPDNGPTTFNHYGDDVARSAGVLPIRGRIGFNNGFGSSVPHFSNPPEMDNFNQGYNQFRTLSNTLASENMPSRRSLALYEYDNSHRSLPEMGSFSPTRPQGFQVMPRTRTLYRFPVTEDRSFRPAPPPRFQGMPQPRTFSRFPNTEDGSDFPTEAPRSNSSAKASVQFPRDGMPSPFQKRFLDQKLAWDAAQKVKEASNDDALQASASASGSIGPGGIHQSVNIYPENAASPNINTRFPSDGPQPGGFYEVSSSSSSSYSNVNGETVYDKKAQTSVNDNGKVTTYVASD